MKILGWEIINSKKQNVKSLKALVPKDSDSGGWSPSSGNLMSSVFSFDQQSSFSSEIDLIRKYRDLMFIPEVDLAIEEIINEMIVTSGSDSIATLILDNLAVSETFKTKIRNEFDYILNVLDFQENAYEYARRWYVDGRLFFHLLIDMNNPRKGIIDIRPLDAMNIRKVREIQRTPDENQIPIITEVEEYFVYNEMGLATIKNVATESEIRISTDSIAYSNSGLVDPQSGVILSNLHKALKIANHLSMIETAMVIYRLTRAPERRVFYIDTGDLPKAKAEEYLQEQMNRHRNKMTYDVVSGQMVDQKSILSMMEDYWMPRRGGTRGTEITTLESGQNLQNMEDVQYFKEKLYRSLNVPILRLQADNSFTYSKDSAIIREELKFARFIDKQRKKFSMFLYDILRKQLILKNLITPSEWNNIKQDIYIRFQRDSFYSEIKDAELLSDQVSLMNDMTSFMGTIFSNNFIYKKVLKMTSEEIEQLQNELKEEKAIKELETGESVNSSENMYTNDMENYGTPQEEFSQEEEPTPSEEEPTPTAPTTPATPGANPNA